MGADPYRIYYLEWIRAGTYGHIRKTEKPPSHYAKRLYYDSLVYDENNLQFMIDRFGVDRIIAGSDYPFLLREAPSGKVIDQLSTLNETEKEKIHGLNALKFLNLNKDKYKTWKEELLRK